MANNFVIFEDQENFMEKKTSDYAEVKRDRIKLAPLTNKVLSNENVGENKVRLRKCFYRFISLHFCLYSGYPLLSSSLSSSYRTQKQ